jgi:hypothetical protein
MKCVPSVGEGEWIRHRGHRDWEKTVQLTG